ncbi:MAG: pyruvate kinase [Hyphomicrobiaceae bacterium]
MKSDNIELLCTLGPASQNDRVIHWLESIGATLLRINLSHTKIGDLEQLVKYIQSRTRVPLCLDTEGAQVRTGPLVDGKIAVRENQLLTAHSRPVRGDQFNIRFYPGYVVCQLRVGDLVSIDFNEVLSQVVKKKADCVVLRILNGGEIGQNKAVTVQGSLEMAPLTAKDVEAIEIGRNLGVRNFALSFANRPEDVDFIRKKTGDRTIIISKIECLNGLSNLEAIARKSDAILIDRGDLSREVPIEQIPTVQKSIIERTKTCGKRVYVATNLLESMTTSPMPTRAEVNDIYSTLNDGANGLVLAGETAIGRYPVQCAKMVVKVVQQFRKARDLASHPVPTYPSSFLDATDPHGGRLTAQAREVAEQTDISDLPTIVVPDDELTDVEQIASGTFSPLTGFMDKDCLKSVLECNRLPTGLVWTMPIVLAVSKETAGRFQKGERVLLTSDRGLKHSVLDITQVFQFDAQRLAREWFGTDAAAHPGAARILARGNHFLSGDLTLIERLPLPQRRYELTPAQLRTVFTHKGWNRVVGFHSRNLIHRAHEAVQLSALEQTHADGLLISPIVGKTKQGDFLPHVILEGYRAMLDYGLYPPGKVVLASFLTYPRFAGPREAVFTAICRKNMGCSHFVVGRDHSGVGNFYGENEARNLFDELGDIGIEPVFFNSIGYDEQAARYVDVKTCTTAKRISGTEIRRALKDGEVLPDWMMRSEVQDVIRAEQMINEPLFQE